MKCSSVWNKRYYRKYVQTQKKYIDLNSQVVLTYDYLKYFNGTEPRTLSFQLLSMTE